GQIADLLQGTWFRLDGSATLVLTARGSRPGDPLADILFAFSFAACLKAAEMALRTKGLETPVPHATEATPWIHWSPVDSVGCAAWADDYAHAQVATTTSVLCQRVVQAAEVLACHAASAGMQLTYAPDKTALMLASDCDPQPEHGLQRNSEGKPGFVINNAVLQQSHFLPLIASYKHLGGILTSNGTPGADNQFRYAQAYGTLRPLYGRFFSTVGIPLVIRRTLLRALDFADGHDETKHRTAISCYAMRRHGPATLLHLLHVHWRNDGARSWIGMFQADIQAVAQYAEPAAILHQMADPV
ncbi:unnamed protein product, partial [Symbiodinium sp. CCMP2456]